MNANFTRCLEEIKDIMTSIGRAERIMEVCGTHTVTACRSGLRNMLPANLKLISGPGCPVCVTPAGYIDRAILISRHAGVIIATFGDLLRVPGTLSSLEVARAQGSDVRLVYSVSDALELAAGGKNKEVVFLAVGFETTAPGIAWAVKTAAERKIKNFFVLTALKTMPAAMAALLKGGELQIDGFICPGHVSVIIGTRPYEFVCREQRIPCVIAGFEPYDMVLAIKMLLNQIASGKAEVQNEYRRSVSPGGNPEAEKLIAEIFKETEAEWRGLGFVPMSGLKLKEEYRSHDALLRFATPDLPMARNSPECLCGDVLCGRVLPADCPLFGKECTPSLPFGPCMVSSEGTCAAYFKYCRHDK
jgi:hydrogenase expression/formation protein HypD